MRRLLASSRYRISPLISSLRGIIRILIFMMPRAVPAGLTFQFLTSRADAHLFDSSLRLPTCSSESFLISGYIYRTYLTSK